VDHFHVLLKTRDEDGNLSYYTIPQYRIAATAARATIPTAKKAPRILAIQTSVLIRSTNNAKNTVVDPAQATYVMLDTTVKAADTSNRFLRRVYNSTVALRNAMGENL